MNESYLNQDADQEEKERLMQLVGFVIGKELFGVDILMVQEIIREFIVCEPSFLRNRHGPVRVIDTYG